MAPCDGKPLLLFVDDDTDIQSAAGMLFKQHDIEVICAHDAQSALAKLTTHAVDLVLLDLNYARGARDGAEGLALLKDILVLKPNLPVVVVTGHSGVTIAVEAMRAGACNFVMKPWNNKRFVTLIKQTLLARPINGETTTKNAMIVASSELKQIVAEADRLALTQAPITICGPSGSGKTTLARRIFALSRDRTAEIPIHAKECNILPRDHGNWLIRDVEELSPLVQHQLADKLDDCESPRVIALSSVSKDTLDVRLNPRLMLHLGMITLAVPPLSQRPDDIAALTPYFLDYFSVRHGLPSPDPDETHLETLKASPWPQNVRSLRATVERAVLTGNWSTPSVTPQENITASATLQDTERMLIESTLRKHKFNVTKASQELGLTRPALYRRMARYGL
ncbi:response regulator [Saccharibacter sp. 17.LH.SD]|uniref:sigma-54-dependent transcriptional regulator n=1 Tax=Saccharibacter sp. 17.LH.SD TaxID=2689393 RepID=UPI0013692C8E|nr:response regulator [Saccharibacter sp. 17.LH.SD]MXV44873.1 response regulator [Saccharibacter sp. 17.LH.SD]